MAFQFVKLSLRNMRKNRLFTLINVLGLALGLAVVILISLHLNRERSYDQFHLKKDRIVRLTMEFMTDGVLSNVAVTGTRPGPQFARDFPEIRNFSRTFIGSQVVQYGTAMQTEKAVLFADSAFFDMFSFPVLAGSTSGILNDKNSVAISESVAARYFGKANAVGQTLKIGKADYLVATVFEDLPAASQMHFDFVLRFENLFSPGPVREDWWTANWITYFELTDSRSIASLESRINQYMQTDDVRAATRMDGNNYLKYHLEPLTRVHLYSGLAGFEPAGSITTVYMFALVAFLILLMACVNYTNLATAQALGRTSEMGMRRAIGASRGQLFWQFIGESFVLALLAAVLAIGFAILMLPALKSITGNDFSASEIFAPGRLAILAGLVALVALLAGSYPAWLIGRISGKSSIRKIAQSDGRTGFFRHALIVLQFGVSVFLIIYTGIILQQMEFMKSKKLGYDREHLIILPVDAVIRENYQAFADAVGNLPQVKSVTGAYDTPEFIEWSDGIVAVDEKGTHEVSLNALPVDLAFVKTLGMELASGRDFQQSDFALMDTSNGSANFRQPYLINETLARKLGWSNEEAVGRKISKGSEGPVMGVIKDFHFESLHEPVKPLVLFLSRDLVRNMMVRVDGHSIESAIASLNTLWKQRAPHRPFTYKFLDDEYNNLYQSEQRNAVMFRTASILAISLGCLGLFGIAAFSVSRRRKEVGIRRVLGAGAVQITLLLTRKFMWLVALAILIALPVAWLASIKWLDQFSFRIEMNGWMIAGVIVMVLVLSFLTVAIQAIQGARRNPVDSIREA